MGQQEAAHLRTSAADRSTAASSNSVTPDTEYASSCTSTAVSTAAHEPESAYEGKIRLVGDQTEAHEWYQHVQRISASKGMGLEGAREIIRSTEEAISRKHITFTKQQKHHLIALQLSVQARQKKENDLDIAQSIIRLQLALVTAFDEDSLQTPKGTRETQKLEQLKLGIRESDEFCRVRQHIFDCPRMTPAAVNKFIKPFRLRMHEETYKELFARGQSSKSVRDASGREALFEGIVAGIAQRQLLEM